MKAKRNVLTVEQLLGALIYHTHVTNCRAAGVEPASPAEIRAEINASDKPLVKIERIGVPVPHRKRQCVIGGRGV